MVSDWITFFISLLQTLVQWLNSMQIAGVSLAWIIAASFLMGIFVRTLVYLA